MCTTERGLLANSSRLSQNMQANSRFVVSFSRCVYSTAKFILCSTACYCRDQAPNCKQQNFCYKPRPLLQTDHVHFPVHFCVQSSPESRFCTVPVAFLILVCYSTHNRTVYNNSSSVCTEVCIPLRNMVICFGLSFFLPLLDMLN